MKKFALIIILLSSSIVAIIPYGTGLITEQQLALFDQSVHAVLGFKPTAHFYQRGWFESSAQSDFALPQSASVYRFTLRHQVHHGFQPLIATIIDTTLLADPLRCTAEEMKIQTIFQANGETTYLIKGNECQWQPDQVQIQIRQLQGDIRLQRDLDLQKLLTLTAPESYWINFTKGTLALSLDQWQLHYSASLAAELNDFHLQGSTNLHQDYLTSILSTSLSSLIFNQEEKYGAGLLELELNHWYAPAVVEIMNTFITVYHSKLASYQKNMTLLGVLMRQGTLLLSHQPEFIIRRFRVTTDEGLLQGSLRVNVQTDGQKFNPFLWTEMLKIEGDVRISRSLLKRLMIQNSKIVDKSVMTEKSLKQQLDQWLSQGILKAIENSDDYQLIINMERGELKINGQTLLR
jgi:uncharacterized protein YdgA (DUF945 family)